MTRVLEQNAFKVVYGMVRKGAFKHADGPADSLTAEN
jgi:hypothetical protein